MLHCDAAALCPGRHFHLAAYNIRFLSFLVPFAMNPKTTDSNKARTHGTTIFHIPWDAIVWLSRPSARSAVTAIVIPPVAAHRQVRVKEARRLDREKRRREPVSSEFEMRMVVA